MADKAITDLTLISAVSDSVNIPGDDGIQTYRMTIAQLKNYFLTEFADLFLKTGMDIPYHGTTAPSGFVMGSGKTIGDGSSGATERANADTEDLYTLLWNGHSNTELVIQDSSGTPTTRGANAAADFAAHKRLPLPDLRGRVPVGKDDMGGTAASRMTSGGSGLDGATLGKAGGSQTHTLVTGEMPSHTHTQNAHHHAQQIYEAVSNGGTKPIGFLNTTGPATYNYNTADTTATNQNTGGGGAHNNTQPSYICNYIIKL